MDETFRRFVLTKDELRCAPRSCARPQPSDLSDVPDEVWSEEFTERAERKRLRALTPADVAGFILLGQNGTFEVAWWEGNRLVRRFASRADILDELTWCPNTHWNYIRPHGARVRPDVRPRRDRNGVEPMGRNLWVDLDETTVDEALERLSRYDVPQPSLIWRTGGDKRGSAWLLWKLRRAIPVEDIESMNRTLAQIAGGDACHDATRLMRMPLSVHNETGRRGLVLHFDATQHEPWVFERAYEASLAGVSLARIASAVETTPAEQVPAERPRKERAPTWMLKTEPCDYRTAYAALRDDNKSYIDGGDIGDKPSRSEREQSLFFDLLRAGYSKGQVAQFMLMRAPSTSRFIEDFDSRRHDGIGARISEAERFVHEFSGIAARNEPSSAKPDRDLTLRRRFLELFDRHKPMRTTDLIEHARTALRLSRTRILELRAETVACDLIDSENRLTAHGEERLRRRGIKGLFTFAPPASAREHFMRWLIEALPRILREKSLSSRPLVPPSPLPPCIYRGGLLPVARARLLLELPARAPPVPS